MYLILKNQAHEKTVPASSFSRRLETQNLKSEKSELVSRRLHHHRKLHSSSKEIFAQYYIFNKRKLKSYKKKSKNLLQSRMLEKPLF